MQLVIAGKAHPADDGGKKLIQEIVRFADDPEVRHRIVFLPNYDIAMAQPLYPGCDVWLNNPLRPYEACGTSGMKAALNGGLNLSILDGWWDEWYDGNNGWAIPSADGVDDPDRRDDLEADALYDLIENEVAPRFYDDDDDGVPGPLDRDGPAHAEVARPQGARRPGWSATTSRELYAPGRRSAPARSTATTPARRELAGLEAAGARGLARRPRRARRVQRRRRRARGRRRRSTCAPSCRSASCRPTTSTCRSCTAGSTATTTCVDTTVDVAARSPRPTRAAGTASTATSPSTAPALRLHRPGASRSNDLLASPAELGRRRAAAA